MRVVGQQTLYVVTLEEREFATFRTPSYLALSGPFDSYIVHTLGQAHLFYWHQNAASWASQRNQGREGLAQWTVEKVTAEVTLEVRE